MSPRVVDRFGRSTLSLGTDLRACTGVHDSKWWLTELGHEREQ